MTMTVKSSSKPGVEFKYGGRLLSATRSSNNLAVDWDVWSKFNTLIEKKEYLRRYDRHHIKNISSINKFKSKLKSYLQQNYILE